MKNRVYTALAMLFILGATFDLLGEVIAFPFKVVAEAIEVIL